MVFQIGAFITRINQGYAPTVPAVITVLVFGYLQVYIDERGTQKLRRFGLFHWVSFTKVSPHCYFNKSGCMKIGRRGQETHRRTVPNISLDLALESE